MMKRIGSILCLAMIMIMTTATMAWGTDGEFKVEKTSPEDGSTGMSVDNMGVKVTFNKDVYNKDTNDANAVLCTLVDKDGKPVPSKVSFSEKNKQVMLVLADVANGAKIEGKSQYTLVIKEGFTSADGTVMAAGHKVKFETLDPKTSMTVSMVMMGVMVVGMVFMTSKEAKKEAQKNQDPAKKKDEKVNPYKVARETGKSVEEIVEKENKRKEKAAAAAAKKARHKRENKVEIASDNKRVKRPRPISEGGATYKHPKKKAAPQKARSTNPKNQTGKQRNKKK